jgi:membrane protease YdiL (CAAX protease family)
MDAVEVTSSRFSGRKRHIGRWLAVILAGLVVSTLAGGVAYTAGHGGHELIYAVLTLFCLMTVYLAFMFTSFANDLWLFCHRRNLKLLLPICFVILVFLLFGIGTGTFAWQSFGTICAFATLPTLFAATWKKDPSPQWFDWLAVACIWLPFDLGLLKNVWLWPQGTGSYILNTAVAVSLAVYLFSSVRRFPDIGFRLQWKRGDLATTLIFFFSFCLLAIPFGLATDFIGINVRPDLIKGLLAPIGIFLFIALPEELLFRGLLQNFLNKKLGNEKIALMIAAVFFGATHFNNGTHPDWRYFVLATLAGLFYGAAYIKTKNLFVPAIIHGLVDSVWMQFLMKAPA